MDKAFTIAECEFIKEGKNMKRNLLRFKENTVNWVIVIEIIRCDVSRTCLKYLAFSRFLHCKETDLVSEIMRFFFFIWILIILMCAIWKRGSNMQKQMFKSISMNFFVIVLTIKWFHKSIFEEKKMKSMK